MADTAELSRLLSLVVYNPGYDGIDGLTPFRHLLERDDAGSTLHFLERELPALEGKRRIGVAFLIAEHLFKSDDLPGLRRLYGAGDAEVRQGTLNALNGEPRRGSEMGAGVVRLAVDGCGHPAAGIRAEACRVLMNQCAWKSDVSEGREPLWALLADPSAEVRQAAAYAVGHFAQRKYDMTAHITPLRHSLSDEKLWVQGSAAWALGRLARHKHDIGAAVPELAAMLASEDEYAAPRRTAAGALLHHAQKSAENAAAVRYHVHAAIPGSQRKEVQKLLAYLGLETQRISRET
jgi:hypothetical protein